MKRKRCAVCGDEAYTKKVSMTGHKVRLCFRHRTFVPCVVFDFGLFPYEYVVDPMCHGEASDSPCPNAAAKLELLTPDERSDWSGRLSCDICGRRWQGVTFSDGYIAWERISR